MNKFSVSIVAAVLQIFPLMANSDLQKTYELRLSAEDASSFKLEALKNLAALQYSFERGRELAVMASNPTLGSSDRRYLEMEWDGIREGVNTILDNARYTDSFMDSYAYFRDGLSFLTLVHPTSSSPAVVKRVSLSSLDSEKIGEIVQIHLPVQIIDVNSQQSRTLKINDFDIGTPLKEYDTFSYRRPDSSAISLAKVINDISNQSEVEAAIEPAVLSLNNLDFSSFQGEIANDSFLLNGISCRGHGVTSVIALITVINSNSSATGVIASLAHGSVHDIELTAAGGRNISLEISDPHLAKAIGNQCDSAKPCLKAGGILLRSLHPIRLESDHFDYLRFPADTITVEAEDNSGIVSADILTQEQAELGLSIFDAALSQVRQAMAALDF